MITAKNVAPGAGLKFNQLDGFVRSLLNRGYFFRDVRFVDSTSTSKVSRDGFGKEPYKNPWDTIATAAQYSAADTLVVVLPGHTESVSAADAWAWANAGIHVVGHATPGRRPVITFNTVVGASILFDKVGLVVENLLFLGGIDALTNPLNVAAADCGIISCEYRDSVSEATDVIVTTAAADRLRIINHVHRGAAGAGAAAAIKLVGGSDAYINLRYVDGNFSEAVIQQVTTVAANILIEGGGQGYASWWRTRNVADKMLKLASATCSGWVGGKIKCRLQDNAINVTEAFDTAALQFDFDGIEIVNADTEKAMLWNGVSTLDA